MRRLMLVTLALLAACSAGAPPTSTPTGTPAPTAAQAWPAEYHAAVCLARRDLREANQAMSDAGAALQAYDVDTAMEQLTRMADKAKEAQDELALAPAWPPGRSLVVYLAASAEHYRKAAGLSKIAITSGDGSETQALGYARTATARLRRAAAAYQALVDATGQACAYD